MRFVADVGTTIGGSNSDKWCLILCTKEAKRFLVKTGTVADSGAAIPVGGWEGVPTGCSVQNDISFHFGTKPDTNNARLVSGEFASVCRRLFKIGPERQRFCPSGSGITTAKMCKDAFYELQGLDRRSVCWSFRYMMLCNHFSDTLDFPCDSAFFVS